MAWRRPGDKPLSEPMVVCLMTHICITQPQWVNGNYDNNNNVNNNYEGNTDDEHHTDNNNNLGAMWHWRRGLLPQHEPFALTCSAPGASTP